jgi:hypothetical protein
MKEMKRAFDNVAVRHTMPKETLTRVAVRDSVRVPAR